ncbi:hypothetical protein M9H77_13380 [Catharanthus roseus]|uniref:Uncharacterized protein n=1 Tax=Catharanthus roseus TaxID=4058 RepID=A0ACC0BK98_CATRO|nr:hypothetical protein M9H77_13380 [Catharanthus roseus]
MSGNEIVRPSGRRGDDDLGPVTDRTGRVEGHTVTASSRGVRGRHSTFDLPVTPTYLAPGFHHGTAEMIGAEFFDQMFGAAPQDSSCSTYRYSHAEYSISSSVPYVPRPADRVCEGDIGFEGDRELARCKKESDPYILRERRMREVNDDQDEGDYVVDEEQPVSVAPVGHSSGSDRRPHHGKEKGLTGSFMSVMSKIAGSRNKRLEVAREVPAPT